MLFVFVVTFQLATDEEHHMTSGNLILRPLLLSKTLTTL